MTISSSEDLVSKIEVGLGSSSALLTVMELEFAASQAINELNWNYPIDESKKIYWCIQRGKRHALDILRVQAARKFQFKNLSLQHTFRQYNDLIQEMDNEFREALNTDPLLMDIDPTGMFGFSIGNGFIYDAAGKDVTKLFDYYGMDNEGFRRTCSYVRSYGSRYWK